MNDQDLYGKTPAGFQEVSTRALKLPQRLRTMLIMVDGTRTVAQLREAARTLSAPEDFLDALLGMGLIAIDDAARVVVNAPAPVPEPLAPPPAAASSAPMGLTAADLPAEGDRFRATLKFMNDSAVDLLGLRAFFFTLKLEKCFTTHDLLALLPDFTKAIAKSNGPEMARALEERARKMLVG